MVEVVQTDADDLARSGHRSADAQAGGVQDRQPSLFDCGAGPVQAAGVQEGAVDIGGDGGQVQQHAVVGADGGPLLAGLTDA